MENYYVYFEHVLIINLILNFLILIITGLLSQVPIKKKRVFFGALIGAAYSFMLLLPFLGLAVNMLTKILVSFVMIYVSFKPLRLKKFWQTLLCFYLVTFLIGGTIFGLGYFIQGSQLVNYLTTINMITDNLFYIFLVVLVGYWLLGKGIIVFLRKNLAQGLLKTMITIKTAHDSLKVEALLDTGNQLRDPISRFPVIIVEYEVLKNLLPEEFCNYFNLRKENLNDLLDKITQTSFATRIRVIPFKSLGEENGLLLGFIPDKLIIHKGEKELLVTQVIVGIYNQKLSPEGNYRALLHPDILG